MKKYIITGLTVLLATVSIGVSAEPPSWVSGNVAITFVAPTGNLDVKTTDNSQSIGQGSVSQVGAGGAVAQVAHSTSAFNLNGAFANIQGRVKAIAKSKATSRSGGTTQACAAASCAQSAH